jgi:hypothetical protein
LKKSWVLLGSWVLSGAGIASAMAGCSGVDETEMEGDDLGTDESAQVAPTAAREYVFLASGSASISDRTQVTGGHIGAAAASGDAVTAGFDARLAVGKATVGRRIVLQDRAQAGDLFATQVSAPFATFASQSEFSAPPVLPPIVAFSAGSTALTVNGGQSATAAAGNFGQVTVNGTLHLSGGVYQFQNLTLGNDAVISADAASTVRVAGRVSGADRVRFAPAGTLGAGALRLVVAGTGATSGGLTLGNDARFKALVMSRAAVRAGARLIASGAVAAGGNIQLGSDSRFAFDTGFECNADANCDDGNVCTSDRCIDGACQHPAVTNGATCTDGNACTRSDSCQAGLCVGSNPVSCTASDQCHDAGTCNTATGACSNPVKASGSACTDGNACTSGDRCSNGTCVSGTPAVCNDGNICTDDSCIPATGCVFTNNTAPCSDGNACTTADVCVGGACAGGAAPNCDDGSACTSDSCDSAIGCVHPSACGAGQVCASNACCSPKTCANLGAECGTRSDGCGGTLNCNSCPGTSTCNPAGRCLPPNNFNEPTGINVCETLIEELIIPPTFEDVLSCDDDACGLFTPDCCVPGLCLLDPLCTIFNPIQITAEIILHPGDVHCSVTLTPQQYLERLVQGRLSDLGDIEALVLTGGLAALFDFDTQVLAAAGKSTPGNVQSLIRTLVQPVYDGGDTGFAFSDMEGVKVVSSAMPTAGLYLPGDRLAITLGPVIVIKSDMYDALFSAANANVTFSDFLTNPSIDPNYIRGVDTLIHEFVHVKQYRLLGQNQFYIQYLTEALGNALGAGPVSFEQEAYAFEIGLTELQGGRWCSLMKNQQNGQIAAFSVPVPLNTCP